jgi:hypothetical protein
VRVVKTLKTFEVISAATGRPQQRRIVILERDDGFYSFAEEYFYRSTNQGKVLAEGWSPFPPEGIFASADIAEIEAQSTVATRGPRDDR